VEYTDELIPLVIPSLIILKDILKNIEQK
jgi:hypothetical protein